MEKDQGPYDMDFLLGNNSSSPSNCNNSCESKENMNSPNQTKEEGELLMNKKRNREIISENEKKSITSGEGTNEKCLDSDHEMHLSIERERRKKMNDMYSSLQALLPPRSSKADKSTIVDEAVKYIKDLEQTREKLEKLKQEKSQSASALKQIMATSNSNALPVPEKQQVAFDKTWAASNMVMNISGDEAQISICTAHKPGLMTHIASVLENHNIDVISATISSNGNGKTSMIQVHGKQASGANSAEETYKQVAEEIMPWIA